MSKFAGGSKVSSQICGSETRSSRKVRSAFLQQAVACDIPAAIGVDDTIRLNLALRGRAILRLIVEAQALGGADRTGYQISESADVETTHGPGSTATTSSIVCRLSRRRAGSTRESLDAAPSVAGANAANPK